MEKELQQCKCGSCDLEVEWIEEDIPGTQISVSEYFVECKICGEVGKSALSYDLSIQNWNKKCMNIE